MDSPLPRAPFAIKARSSLLCLAISDAFGAPYEFLTRGKFTCTPVFAYNHHFFLPPGTFTDDTSQALCLSRALLSSPSLSLQAQNYVKWWKTGFLSGDEAKGCFDTGLATTRALGIWDKLEGEEEEDVLKEVENKLGAVKYRGNGSLMRVLPVAIAHWKDPARAMDAARASSRTTHPNSMCQEACAVYVSLITAIFRAAISTKRELLEKLQSFPYETPELREKLGPDAGLVEKKTEVIKSSGYVLNTIEAAMWGFFTTESFEEGLFRVVNLGDDADTVAAVYGGLAGAWYAQEGFWDGGKMKEWKEGLRNGGLVEGIAEELVVRFG